MISLEYYCSTPGTIGGPLHDATRRRIGAAIKAGEIPNCDDPSRRDLFLEHCESLFEGAKIPMKAVESIYDVFQSQRVLNGYIR